MARQLRLYMPAIEQAAIVLKQHMILFVSMWPYAQLGHQNISFRSSISVMVLKYVKMLNYKIRNYSSSAILFSKSSKSKGLAR